LYVGENHATGNSITAGSAQRFNPKTDFPALLPTQTTLNRLDARIMSLCHGSGLGNDIFVVEVFDKDTLVRAFCRFAI
jgi:hypothetical protein